MEVIDSDSCKFHWRATADIASHLLYVSVVIVIANPSFHFTCASLQLEKESVFLLCGADLLQVPSYSCFFASCKGNISFLWMKNLKINVKECCGVISVDLR